MNILLIDNTMDHDCWGSPELRRIGALHPGVTVHTRRAPNGDLPSSPSGFDKVIVSGSKTRALDDAPWVEQLLEFIRRTLDQKKPYLGVCYGHQMLARAVGGKTFVRAAKQSEHGWTKIKIIDDSELMRGLNPEFHSFSSHYDEVGELPRGLKRLAYSDACAIQACKIEGAPVFGIQFHPEKNLEEAKKSIAGWKKKKSGPKRILDPEKSDKLYSAEVGDTIFKNFLSL